MRLSEWAKREGVHYQAAWKWFGDGHLRSGSGVNGARPKLRKLLADPTVGRLSELLDAGDARVLSMSVTFRQGRWHAAIACLVRQPQTTSAPAGTVVGVDVGVTHLAVLSTGAMIKNPKALAKAQRALRRYQRRLDRQRRANNPDCYRPDGQAIAGKRPTKRSKNMTATERRVRRLHARVANTRADAIHKLTHQLATENRTVIGENLAVAGLCRGGNRGLRRSIHDASLGEIHRQIAYKTAWHGGEFVQADRFYPSSKTCSQCGAVKAKLPLSARTYRCNGCGLAIDRDLNAARNLAALVADGRRPEWPGDQKPQGRDPNGVVPRTRVGPGHAGPRVGHASLSPRDIAAREASDGNRHPATGD